MSWIYTFTGRRFDVNAPDADAVDILDIAHALSLLCRFNGHCRSFYSVAEHSVRVSWQVSIEHALAGLLHDAAEAYCSDVPRPIKQLIPSFSEIESAVLAVILTRYGLDPVLPGAVHLADDQLLVTELRDLLSPPRGGATEARPKSPLEPLPTRIEPWTAAHAEKAFLGRFSELRRD